MKFSVITVSFNSEDTIKDTFDSVRIQKLCGLELEYIHIDGMSTDTTILISNNYQDIITKQICEPDSGIYNAMNKGLQMATGDIIGFLNSDDLFSAKDVLCTIAEKFQKNDELDIVYGDINYVDSRGKVKRRWKTGQKRSFRSGWHPAHPGFYARTEVFKKHGGFDEKLTLAADFDLMLRFLEGAKLSSAYCEKVFVNMTLGGATNASLSNIIRGNAQIIQSFKKNSLKPRFGYTLLRWFNKLLQTRIL